jgi:NAD(P)-dependent dehydrogenase (short-subunit alcohol dehydrogenase family)
MTDPSSKDAFGLTGRVCVVTGAASGIGRAIAITLAEAGARIAILDRSAEGGQDALDEIERKGGSGICLACDVSNPTSVAQAAAATLAALGRCDVLVNNAGMIKAGALESLSFEDWNTLLSVNLTGYFLCSQTFGRQMRESGKGALVHIASIAANHATPFSGAYSVAKAGVAMLSRQLAIEWGQYGIRSNVVNPGMILTPLSQSMYDRPGVTERRSEAIPAGRIGRPDDIAQAVLFLASDRAAYINGDEITVDGGFSRMLMNLIPRAGYERPAN